MVYDTSAIVAERLTKIYGSGNTEVVAMCDASLAVDPGEVIALVGPSGAGKSTFLAAVGLINPPASGRIFIGGELVMDGPTPMVNLAVFRRKHIGYVFQKSNLIPFLTARENVQIAMELDDWLPRDARHRAMDLLDQLGVGERADYLPTALSAGQQQRVAISRALANHPNVILADEPSASLDSHRGRQVMGLFHEIARTHGAAVIVVTHDLRSLDLFDQMYTMEDGSIRVGVEPIPAAATPAAAKHPMTHFTSGNG